MARHPLLFFTHILKAGGTSIEAALRQALGVRHMAVDPPIGWIYTLQDFRFDRRLNPLAVSYSSHWLRPFVKFGSYDDRIAWHTMLREPAARYRSHRQHHVERFGTRASFEEWSANPVLRNWQTRQIAGEEDLLAAHQILEEKYRFVGLLERFDESMVLMRRRLEIPSLPVEPGAVHNPSLSRRVRDQVEEELVRNAERVRDCNQLDLQLYRHVRDVLFPRQIAEYGEDRLTVDVARARAEPGSLATAARETSHLLLRKLFQAPVYRLRTHAAQRSGRLDVRR